MKAAFAPTSHARDLILFGAMLVTPLPGAADWGSTARRQKTIYSDGLLQKGW